MLWVAFGVFALTLLNVPIIYSYKSSIYGDEIKTQASTRTVLDVGANDRIRFDVLGMEWLGIVVVAGFLFAVLKGERSD